MVVYLDTDGGVVSAEEFLRLVEHITLEGARHTTECGVGLDITLAAAAPAAELPGSAAGYGFTGWRTGNETLG